MSTHGAGMAAGGGALAEALRESVASIALHPDAQIPDLTLAAIVANVVAYEEEIARLIALVQQLTRGNP